MEKTEDHWKGRKLRKSFAYWMCNNDYCQGTSLMLSKYFRKVFGWLMWLNSIREEKKDRLLKGKIGKRKQNRMRSWKITIFEICERYKRYSVYSGSINEE